VILLIDNYDSFTWNLVQRLGEVAPALPVEGHRNDQIDCATIARLAPSHLVISPGPCTPDEAGISCDVVRRFAGRMPILGVCLGHQAIGQVFGGRIVRAGRLMHGKVDRIEHAGRGLFAGLDSPIEATRYHSLVIDPPSLPRDFEVDAWSTAPDGAREIIHTHPAENTQRSARPDRVGQHVPDLHDIIARLEPYQHHVFVRVTLPL